MTKQKGPIYGVELIDVLPLSPTMPDGMKQAMPSAHELHMVAKSNARVVAAYEVLLAHYRYLQSKVEVLAEESEEQTQ